MSKKAETVEENVESDAKEIEEQYEEHLIELAEKETAKQTKKNEIKKLADVPGLGKKTLDILTENNINEIEELMTTRLIELQAMGIQRAIAKKIRASIAEANPKYKFFCYREEQYSMGKYSHQFRTTT